MSGYSQDTDLAIVGMTCRFPGANTTDEFWKNLEDGVESIKFFSDDALLEAGVDPLHLQNPDYVKARPVLDHVDAFDADFFGYSPREAETIDPQQRLFLTCAWEVLEAAGYQPDDPGCHVGVFGGSGPNSYLLDTYRPEGRFLDSTESYFRLMLGSEKDYLTTRVSYKLNLTGPSLAVQTACSTSLVALHLAGQAILSGECDMAIAGGVTVRMPQLAGYIHRRGLPLSSDGHCRAFDAAANGTLFGSGLGMVLIKRLDDAVADRDHVHAIIKATAINNDGAVKAGFTAPNINRQADVIEQALQRANVDRRSVSYIEAHGTGTELGDPIEVGALNKVFAGAGYRRKSCALGTVKTNIGHMAAAAGMAGLIKTVLAMQNELLPPSLHYTEPNPQIDFASGPFYVNTDLTPWKANGDEPLRAGVSSFGFGGTNSHCLLQQAIN